MAAESSKSADAQLASDVADKSLDGPAATSKAAEEMRGGEEEDEEEGEDEVEGETGTEQTSKAKKKRKPKKKKKAAATGEDGDKAVVKDAASQQTMPAKDIQQLLQQLALSQPDANKKEGKAPEEYKFWNTQPVPKFTEPNLLQTTKGKEGKTLPEGAILPDEVCKASAKPEPEKLVEGFEWDLVELGDEKEMQELYDLLYNHYVEDTEGSFRFNYSKAFLNWALKPPGWKKEWHIGVRTKTPAPAEGEKKAKGKLVAFISGVPVTLRIRQSTVKAVEINFLTIHRKLRSKRLAPVLIKEVTRQCYRNGIYQALYTAGTLLPTPVTTCRYYHRSLDWPHLYKTGFSHLPHRSTEGMQVRKYFLPSKTSTKHLRPMKPADVDQVRDLLVRYIDRFHLKQDFSREEMAHLLCSEASKGVVWAYVVEQDGKITDLVSFYLLEVSLSQSQRIPECNADKAPQSTVLKANGKETIRAAYLYYYATETAFSKPNDQAALKARLDELVHDALILAKKDEFHVFNALTLLDNPLFLKDQKFEPGDGRLHYYLFNWRTPQLGGGIDENNNMSRERMGGVGVVML